MSQSEYPVGVRPDGTVAHVKGSGWAPREDGTVVHVEVDGDFVEMYVGEPDAEPAYIPTHRGVLPLHAEAVWEAMDERQREAFLAGIGDDATINELISIVSALAMTNPVVSDDVRGEYCALCAYRVGVEDDHEPDCPYRLAVEATVKTWRMVNG